MVGGPICEKERGYNTDRHRWKEDKEKTGVAPTNSNGDVAVCKSA